MRPKKNIHMIFEKIQMIFCAHYKIDEISTCGSFEGGRRKPNSLPSSGSSMVYASLRILILYWPVLKYPKLELKLVLIFKS